MVALIDTHQHLIYPDIAGYAWTEGIEALADQAFPLERYHQLTAGHDLVGAIFMETGADDADYQAEARFVASLGRQPDSGILGLIASCRPETDEGYEAWLEECEDLGVVGFRRILHVMPDELSTTDTFRANIRKLGQRGLPFDLCMLPRQLGLAADLARACDNTTIILNHCGVPDIAGGGLDPWRQDIATFASLPNTVCKLSGLLAYCAAGQANQAAIQPYVDHVLEFFGPARMVWGSDWPVVNLANGLPDWLETTEALLSALSKDEATAIGTTNAARLFGLDLRILE